jgi:predicted HAD superfamily Cof-like phosphohydrolase
MQTFGQSCPSEPIIPSKEDIDLRVRLSAEELQEYQDAAYAGDLVEVADALTDRLYVLLGDYVAHGLGHLLVPLFSEVQRSNMSKLTKEGEVLRREDGKILKSDQFSPPDLYGIILADRYKRVPKKEENEE